MHRPYATLVSYNKTQFMTVSSCGGGWFNANSSASPSPAMTEEAWLLLKSKAPESKTRGFRGLHTCSSHSSQSLKRSSH